MRKPITIMVALFVLMALAIPTCVSASDVEGYGLGRTVTLYNNESVIDSTNFSVVVPTALNNETINSFVFSVIDISNTTDDFIISISIDSNGTWYNETVSITSIQLDTVTANINYSAFALPLNDTANITIELVFDTNYTSADIWWGEIAIVDAQEFGMVNMTDMIMNLITVMITILFIVLIVKFLKDAVDPSKKKKK